MFLTNKIKQRIRQYLTRRLEVPEIPTALERLSQRGFQPEKIFDVGAYQGDFAKLCFQHFPMAKVACFEVLEHKVKELDLLASEHHNMQVFSTLLGASIQENVSFNQAETASSVLLEKVPQNFAVKSYPMTTIDQIVQQHYDGKSPQFLKIDVQGYELEVLKGAEQSLPSMEIILTEINLIDIHENVPLLAEIVSWLDARDWVVYDICGLARRPLDQALWQSDFIFVPRYSHLRSDKRWIA